MYSIRTGLALEALEAASEAAQVEGVASEEIKADTTTVTRISVTSDEGAKRLGRPKGTYITVEIEHMASGDAKELEEAVRLIGDELKKLVALNDGDVVLVCGVGNYNITPDSLGPLVINNVVVTRHLRENMPELFEKSGLREVAAIAPGVLGQTGVEAAEIVKGVVERVRPAAVFVIDSLASRKMRRLATTVQLSDSGLTPGGGIGNRRAEISKDTLGVPVVAIGVPTVVDAATLACDVMEETGKLFPGAPGGGMPEEEKYRLIRDALTPYDLNLIVTPKDIDAIVRAAARTVGFAINRALQGDISIEDMTKLLA